MSLKAITSLADLEFKAKTDEHYQQLAILGAQSLGYHSAKDYQTAIEKLHYCSLNHNPESCEAVVREVNHYLSHVKIVKPKPAVKPSRKKVRGAKNKEAYAKIIENLKKKKTVPRKLKPKGPATLLRRPLRRRT